MSLPTPSFPDSSDDPAAGPRHDPYAALRLANYRNYVAGNACSLIGSQAFSVAIGWELLKRTNSGTALGLVGAAQILPILVLAIPAGHLIDRFNRKTIILIDQILLVFSAAAMGTASLFSQHIPDWTILRSANHALESFARLCGAADPHFTEHRHLPILYALLFLNGVIRSVNQPAKQSLLPQLVPMQVFANAVTWNTTVFEMCNVIGPTLAGGLLAVLTVLLPNSTGPGGLAFPLIYYFTAACHATQLFFFLPLTLIPMARTREPVSLRSLSAGLRFVFSTRLILACMTLDMFAVLLGGATALFPIFAEKILFVGPLGFGALRAAPSIGAISMAMLVAHLPPMKHAGRNLLLAVAGYGLATLGFGATYFVPHALGPTLGLAVALVCLLLTGAFDNISVVVRHTLVQLSTPDPMRGRVSAVNAVFISCSNELGSFESGLTTDLFTRVLGTTEAGAMLSVATGGIGTLVVVATCGVVFPALRYLGPLQSLKPAEESVHPPTACPVETAIAAAK